MAAVRLTVARRDTTARMVITTMVAAADEVQRERCIHKAPVIGSVSVYQRLSTPP